MLICIVRFILDAGNTLTGLTGLGWSCGVRPDNVLAFVLFPIFGHVRMCEVQVVYPPINIG